MEKREQRKSNPNLEAYRGYLIRRHPLTGATWIEKGGAHIAYAANREDAVKSIDYLAEYSVSTPVVEIKPKAPKGFKAGDSATLARLVPGVVGGWIGAPVRIVSVRPQRKIRGFARSADRIEFDFAGASYFVNADAGALEPVEPVNPLREVLGAWLAGDPVGRIGGGR